MTWYWWVVSVIPAGVALGLLLGYTAGYKKEVHTLIQRLKFWRVVFKDDGYYDWATPGVKVNENNDVSPADAVEKSVDRGIDMDSFKEEEK